MDLTSALEASGENFIGFLGLQLGLTKKPKNSNPRTGYLVDSEERMKEPKRGLSVHDWAPELEILSQGAVGAFLSHFGWNSMIEALCHGKVILGS